MAGERAPCPGDDRGLRFGVLGPVEVWRGETAVRIGSAKHQRLLTVLLLSAPERVGRDAIVEFVWGANPPKSAVNLVQKYVGELRRSLSADGALLELVSGGYRLRVTGEELDSAAFTGLLVKAGTDPARAEECLRDGLALWRGQPFHGIDTEAVASPRAKLEEQRLAALEMLAELRMVRGEHRELVAELAQLTVEHPFRERLRELQMTALYRCGRQADALAVHHDVRTLLAEQLGVDPSRALTRLYEQILRADPELAWVPEPVEPVEPAVQVLPAHQLPPDLPDFVGRAEQVDELAAMLAHRAEGDPPPVAVVAGGPGIGKTSLVVHTAHLTTPAFPDGQLYLDLAGTSAEPRDPATMLAEVLRVLGVNGAGIPAELSARAALYRSLVARRRLLLLLDDAADAAQVRPLLPGVGGCAVLVTSRNLLPGLPGARHVDLDVLRGSEACGLLAGVVGADRVAREPAEADAIVRSCGYLPLAVRIAGAKLACREAWSLRVLSERLADESSRLGELRAGDLEIRASFALSLRCLPADAVRAFHLLGSLGSQTVPGWVLGPLLGRRNADGVLDTLLEANLLRLVGTDPVGQARYRMHDLLRMYAVEGAAALHVEVRGAAVTRLLGTWLTLAALAVDRLPGSLFAAPPGSSPRGPLPGTVVEPVLADPMGWLDAERLTLLGAVELAASWGLAEQAWELAATLVPYYDHRSQHEDWKRSHQTALRVVRGAGNLWAEAVLLRNLGQVRIYRAQYDRATDDMTRSALLFAETGDKTGEARAIAGLCTLRRVQGDYEHALELAQQALEVVVPADDRHMEAQLRSGIASMLLARGRGEEARTWFMAALRVARALGDPHREAVVLCRMSGLYESRGEIRQTVSCLRFALRLFDEIQDEQCAATNALLRLGRLYTRLGDRDAAEPLLRRAVDICRRLGHRKEQAECWQLLGELDVHQGDQARARDHLGRCLSLLRDFAVPSEIHAVEAALAGCRDRR